MDIMQQLQEQAVYMANVWKSIRENGWDYIVQYGDVEGVDFVANRILAAQPALALDAPQAAIKSDNSGAAHQ